MSRSAGVRPVLDLYFLGGALPGAVTFTRASSATDGLYTDAAASSFNSYSTNVPRMLTAGLLIEEARTNFLLNSAVPVTQTTASLGTGTYVFWCIGTGSVTSSAGTATASGLGAITGSQGTFQTIIVTVAGTLTFTVSGSINRFQLELGAFPTSFISSAGATATRAADLGTVATSAFAWNPAASTFVAQFILGAFNGGNPAIVGLNAPGQARPLFSQTGLGFFDGTTATGTVNNISLNAVSKAASAWNGSGVSVDLNAGTIATGAAPASFATTTTLALGTLANGGLPAGQIWFQRVKYFSQRLPDTQLQTLTT